MKTYDQVIGFGQSSGSKRVRGFQPPWRTVLIYKCQKCGGERRLRKNWHGPTPQGGFICGNTIPEAP